MKNILLILMVCIILFFVCQPVYSWSDVATHAAITEKAIQLSTMDDYLKNQVKIKKGITQEFEIALYPALEERLADLDSQRTTRSALDWVKTDSQLEDKILITQYRSRHHFHDPTRNIGLNNYIDHQDWDAPGTSSWLPLGSSALAWATTGYAAYEPYNNHDKWLTSRNIFYHALTKPAKAERDASLAESLMKFGKSIDFKIKKKLT